MGEYSEDAPKVGTMAISCPYSFRPSWNSSWNRSAICLSFGPSKENCRSIDESSCSSDAPVADGIVTAGLGFERQNGRDLDGAFCEVG